MAQNVTIAMIVAFLEKRGRWLCAGNDNLPGFIAGSLGYRSDYAKKTTRDILLSNPEDIVVEFDPRQPTRITRIGLPTWLEDGSVLTDEIPGGDDLVDDYAQLVSDNAALREEAASLRAALAESNAQLAAAQADIDSLLGDDATDGTNVGVKRPTSTEEITRLEGENAQLRVTLEKAKRHADNARNARANTARERSEAIRAKDAEIAGLQALVATLEVDAQQWRDFIEIVRQA